MIRTLPQSSSNVRSFAGQSNQIKSTWAMIVADDQWDVETGHWEYDGSAVDVDSAPNRRPRPRPPLAQPSSSGSGPLPVRK